MAATAAGAPGSRFRPRAIRTRWRRWRRGRPFWGGLLVTAAGVEICAIPLAPLEIMLHQGVAGVPSILLGLVLIVLGQSAWFAPQYRGLAGVLTVLVAAATLVLANLGGFFLGTIAGVIGGSLIFAWQPITRQADEGTTAEPTLPTGQGPHSAPRER